MRPPTFGGGPLSFLPICLALVACEDSTLPVIPDSEPRFTGVAIGSTSALPAQDGTVQPGALDYSITAYYQVSSGWAGEEVDMYLQVWSIADGAYLRFEYGDVLPLDDEGGTLRFQGTMTVPNCGSIDRLEFSVEMWPVDGDPPAFLADDFYRVDVSGTGSAPCPL